jgi:hypothetical protein
MSQRFTRRQRPGSNVQENAPVIRIFIRHEDNFSTKLRFAVVSAIRCRSQPTCCRFQTRLMPANIEVLQLLGFFAPLCLLCGALPMIDIRRGIMALWHNSSYLQRRTESN